MIKMLNKLSIILIVILLVADTYAAVVSENDGAAFITHAEFDSLKNEFQSKIDAFNVNIDNKLNNAISSYISGVSQAKKSERKPYVASYSDIMWISKFMLHGQWRKWTNNTTYTQSSGNVWFAPSLSEKRHSWRGTSWYVWNIDEMAFGEFVTYFNFSLITMRNGLTMGPASWVASAGRNQTCPTLVFYLTEDKYRKLWYVGNKETIPLRNMFVLTQDTYSYPHTATKISGSWIYQHVGTAVHMISTPSFLTPHDGEYLRFRYQTYNNSDGLSSTHETALDKNNTIFPVVWATGNAFSNCGFGTNANATITTDDKYIDSSWFSTGCTWHFFDEEDKQVELLTNMMLGSNFDLDVNIAKQTFAKSEGVGYDMQDATAYADAECQLNSAQVTQPNDVNVASGRVSFTSGVNANIKVPHWPTKKLRDQTSNKFIYNDAPLKYGQGLPILVKSNEKCDVQVEFKYKINYLLNSTDYTSSQSLYIDLKRGDFLDKSTNVADFYQAYNDIVESGKTSLTKYRYQNYAYPQKTGTIKMTVPIEKGDSVWLRLRPQNETGGYYAKMSDLKVTLLTQ